MADNTTIEEKARFYDLTINDVVMGRYTLRKILIIMAKQDTFPLRIQIDKMGYRDGEGKIHNPSKL